MAVWVSELEGNIQGDDGAESGIKFAVLNSVTDASGQATFDLSELEVEEIFSATTNLIGLALVSGTTLISQSLTEIVALGKQENVVTVTLGLLLQPMVAVAAGVNMQLTLIYR